MSAVMEHRWWKVATVVVLSMAAASCDQDGMPTAPADKDPAIETATPPAQPPGPDGLLSPLAKHVDARANPLVSTEEERAAGRYRFQLEAGAPAPAIARDEFLLSTIDGEPFVRRVLTSEISDGVLILETGPAFWHEVVQGGTYGMTVPIGKQAPATLRSGATLPALMMSEDGTPSTTSAASPALNIGPMGGVVPPLTHVFDETDICLLIDDFLEEHNRDEKLCDGERHSVEVGSGVSVGLTGVLDTLKIVGGHITVSGDMDIDMTVNEGGFSGGTPPTFYPCNIAAYSGCLTTPTGAAFIEWLRQYVPEIPEVSLRPVRVCVPGLPVRIKAGYWDYSGFLPVWRLPTFVQCRVTNIGVRPTIILPSITSSTTRIKPHVQGKMVARAVGDGELKVKVAIPSLGYSAVYSAGSQMKAKAELGLFIEMRLTAKNTGVSSTYTFDRIVELAQDWNPSDGWSSYREVIRNDRQFSIHDFTNPDSLVLRFGAVASAGVEICFAFTVCEVSKTDLEDQDEAKFKIVGKAGLDVSAFGEMTFNREPVHPTEPDIDNWHLSTDYAYDLHVKAGLEIPLTNWILPDVPREFEDTYECCRLRIHDLYGVGIVNVTAATTGVAPDPDGYQVRLQRMDTLPVILDAGTTRTGKALEHGTALQLDVPSNGNVSFGRVGDLPCPVWYSDAALTMSPAAGLIVSGLRAAGVNVPTYALTGPCDLLIGRYQVTLTGVAENCTVVGGPTQSDVWLLQSKLAIGRSSNLTAVDFVVECGAAEDLGDIVLTTNAATSPDFAQDYEVYVDEVSYGLIGPKDTRTLTLLRPGARNVRISGGPTNCEVPAPLDVDVVASVAVDANFGADCTLPPGALAVEATTAGSADGTHQLLIDGQPAASMPLQGAGIVTGLAGETPLVVHVIPAAPNCRATTPTPFITALNAAADPLTLPFALECTTGAIVTAEGVVESSANPTQPVRLRLDDGTTRTLAGPARADLTQLGGARVQVRGEMLGTSLSVYGFDIVPAAGERVWTGILMQRDDGWWLLGAQAVHVLDAPAGMTDNAGALMWVTGPIGAIDEVAPRLYGTLRNP